MMQVSKQLNICDTGTSNKQTVVTLATLSTGFVCVHQQVAAEVAGYQQGKCQYLDCSTVFFTLQGKKWLKYCN